MKLTLLGTGNSGQVPVYNCRCPACERARRDPAYRRGPTCASIEHQGERWLLDAGLMDLAERFPPGSFKGFLQTHYHADHAQGFLHLRWGQDYRLPVLGPPDPQGFADLYKHPGILDFSRTLAPFEPLRLMGLDITPVPLRHSLPTFGYVFSDGKRHWAYLTDTVGLPEDTFEFLKQRPLQLMVLDCSFSPRPQAPRGHNDLTRALDIVERLQVEKTVLTHIGHEFDAWLMAQKRPLPANVLVGSDAAVFR